MAAREVDELLADSESDTVSRAEALFDLESLQGLVKQYAKTHRSRMHADPEDSQVMSIQTELPLSYTYRRNQLFVRPCYSVLYEIISLCFEEDFCSYISVTGTPGIGKSVFYIYFFHRFRAENPEIPLITAAFGKDRNLLQYVVYRPNGNTESGSTRVPIIEGGMYLFDGPPSGFPRVGRMVAFTSPHVGWLTESEKEEDHLRMYVPPWTFDELKQANELCGFNIPVNVVLERFKFFGGSARFCLGPTNKPYVARAKDTLLKKIAVIKTYSDLENIWSNLSHGIFHSIPVVSETLPFVAFEKTVFCSDEVRGRVLLNIRDSVSIFRPMGVLGEILEDSAPEIGEKILQ